MKLFLLQENKTNIDIYISFTNSVFISVAKLCLKTESLVTRLLLNSKTFKNAGQCCKISLFRQKITLYYWSYIFNIIILYLWKKRLYKIRTKYPRCKTLQLFLRECNHIIKWYF